MTDVYIDAKVAAIQQLHLDILQLDKSTITIYEFIQRQAQRLQEAHASGQTAVIFHLACWCKPLIGKPHQQIMEAQVSLELAQQTIAAEYGFGQWDAVLALADTGFDTPFETCIDQMLKGNLVGVREALQRNPALARQKSQYGHQATLLHYLAANGVESYRQVTPLNAAEMAQVIVDAGADVAAIANIYGGSNALALLVSSAHPANAGVVDSVRSVLERAEGS